MHGCMRTCNKFSWGGCWDSEMSYFHPPFSLHFIIPLTCYHITFLHTLGFHLLIFHFIHFCIISEFMINYQKMYILYIYIYISQEYVSFVMQEICEELISPPPYQGDNYASLFLRRKSWRHIEKIMEAYRENHGGISYPKEKIMEAYLILRRKS